MKKKLSINHKQMEQGYLEMSNINLTISQEDFHLEQEGESVYEKMVIKKAEGEAK